LLDASAGFVFHEPCGRLPDNTHQRSIIASIFSLMMLSLCFVATSLVSVLESGAFQPASPHPLSAPLGAYTCLKVKDETLVAAHSFTHNSQEVEHALPVRELRGGGTNQGEGHLVGSAPVLDRHHRARSVWANEQVDDVFLGGHRVLNLKMAAASGPHTKHSVGLLVPCALPKAHASIPRG
jgi:hypothetical protein